MIELSEEQKQAVKQIQAWYENESSPYLTLGGYAGSGKSFLISQLEKIFGGINIAYCAFAGKAVDVLRTKLSAAGIQTKHYVKEYDAEADAFVSKYKSKVTTIHSLIMQPSPVHFCGCGECKVGKPRQVKGLPGTVVAKPTKYNGCSSPLTGENGYPLADVLFGQKDILNADLVVVDEASMVNGTLFEQLLSYQVPVLAVGDHGQLPPVGKDSMNLMKTPDIRLETVHRQALDNPILAAATTLRSGSALPYGTMRYSDDPDAARVVVAESVPADWPISDSTLIVVGTNKQRVAINRTLRKAFGYPENEVVVGDRVICLKNYHLRGLFNGMRGKVTAVHPHDDPDSVKFDVELESGGTFDGIAYKPQFNNERTTMEEIPKHYTLWDYSYAMTCHKCQGSQNEDVIVVGSGFGDSETRRRWKYTAATRATNSLLLVDRMW